MKQTKASISHDEAVIRQLREGPEFAAEYLGAALEGGEDEPRVLLVALRRIAEASLGIAKLAKAAGVEQKVSFARCRHMAIPVFPRWLP